MAYREFYKPIDFPLYDYSPLGEGLANLVRGVEAESIRRRSISQQYKYALEYGQFDSDNQFKEQYVKDTINAGRSYYRNPRKSTINEQDLLGIQEKGKRIAGDIKGHENIFKSLDQEIDKLDKRYYNPVFYRQLLGEAMFGETEKINPRNTAEYEEAIKTRGERIQQVRSMIGKDPRGFIRKNYASDWVKKYGKKTLEDKKGGPQVERSQSISSPFWDYKTGSHSVTDQHVLDYIRSRPDVQASLEHDVKNEISDEVDQIQKLINQGDERVQKFKGMDDGEIMLHLVANEKDNVINSNPFNTRVRERGKRDLHEAAGITIKTDVNYKAPKTVNNVNDDQRHEFTYYNNEVGDDRLAGPGGSLMQKNGKPLTFQVDSENSFDLRTGRRSRRVGEAPFNVTGYQLMLIKQNGAPLFLSGESTDDLIGALNKLSDEDILDLRPSPQLVFRGYSIDKNSVLGDINRKKGALESALADAIQSGNKEEAIKVESQLAMVEMSQQLAGRDDVSDEELISSMRKSGVATSGVRYDELLVPSQADYKRLKSITRASDGTGGLDLSNQKHWSEDMVKFRSAYEKRITQATQNIGNRMSVEKRKLSEPIVSSGADEELALWSKDNVYKVGNNVYFYDRSINQWQWAKSGQ